MSETTSESVVRSFVETATGGRIERLDRAATGASRATWFASVRQPDGTAADLVARVDTGDGPLSGTELDLVREASVYRALAGTAVRIPRLVATSPDVRMLLVERAPGSEQLAAIADAGTRQRVADDYFEALAELHRVDAGKLDLGGLHRASRCDDATGDDIALWLRIFEGHAGGEDPMLRFAFDWLASHVPRTDRPAALCHGDAGPGNFLFVDDRVTALLDWEFAHLGDPRDDLAWVAVRSQLLGGFGDLAAGFAVWERAAGLRAERAAVETYRALVLTRMATSCRVALGHAGARSMDTGVYEMLLPYLRFLLPEALARAGCEGPECRDFAREGEETVAAHAVLRDLAQPLGELPP